MVITGGRHSVLGSRRRRLSVGLGLMVLAGLAATACSSGGAAGTVSSASPVGSASAVAPSGAVAVAEVPCAAAPSVSASSPSGDLRSRFLSALAANGSVHERVTFASARLPGPWDIDLCANGDYRMVTAVGAKAELRHIGTRYYLSMFVQVPRAPEGKTWLSSEQVLAFPRPLVRTDAVATFGDLLATVDSRPSAADARTLVGVQTKADALLSTLLDSDDPALNPDAPAYATMTTSGHLASDGRPESWRTADVGAKVLNVEIGPWGGAHIAAAPPASDVYTL